MLLIEEEPQKLGIRALDEEGLTRRDFCWSAAEWYMVHYMRAGRSILGASPHQ